ncbi:MAG: hypothetical protein A2Z91_01295 [Deltaproteobacteria bacterium GWA2_38_16]|nr:MAG: hypothetical protein A2Z91_01295 [Deltaproteobacteria bacterium GWA2_38_16]OGQ02182.1 MAG: hypothetical protein A3D19_05370 [Deltaproteobacteria bacterium RIFCSPHIGHO2_02_FULL_38_15]OGQ34472.1 MAG: hypothetical protein A3A72_04875 [Deltaproteobacteria bacterium RIFCSPLOWO2_01_FULL_38_9]OGQ61584.1 MAG: hypothetical protein A3G92_04735 [Deltaproteobacteria bacterium RIFCSPLOWO2_12_FULL_38_8]HBQ21976.1 hypothetical protein [Deltaproteobacteria bacterium]
MKLNVKAFALTCGIFWGASLFLMTVWVVWRGEVSNGLLESFKPFYAGYALTYVGSAIGLVWGFLDGLFCGAVFGWLYNWLSK